ncbi:anti-sigma factor [soil metagenome]
MSEDIHALSGAYAVDALDEIERAEFEKHLAVCTTCRAEVDELQEAATMIAETVAVEPPPALRDRVLHQISTVRPMPPVTSLQTRRRRWFTGMLVAAVAVIATSVGITRPWVDETPAQLSAVDRVLSASDVSSVSADLPAGGSVTLYVSEELDQVAMVADDLPPLPDDRVYEVWLANSEGSMVPAGLVPDGLSDGSMVLDGTADGATGVGITIEPAGGSPEPTSDPVALVNFA